MERNDVSTKSLVE